MGKIKSAIITALLSAAIAVLAVFALFSWQVPGSNKVKRYNSFISSISLGADLTGNATTVLYPEGVISSAEYSDLDDADKSDYIQSGGVYVNREQIEDYGNEEGFKAVVAQDAEILSKRLAEKGFTGYSVVISDGYTLSVSVPTGFTYAAYSDYRKGDTSLASDRTSAITQTVRSLAYNGELSLRNAEAGNAKYDNILTKITDDVTTFFKSISLQSAGGNYAVKFSLTKEGRAQFKSMSETVLATDSSDSSSSSSSQDTSSKAIGFYVGDNQLMSLTLTEAIDSSVFYIQGEQSSAEDYSIVLSSVAKGKTITLDYSSDEAQIIYESSELGGNAALFLGIALLLILAGAIAYSVVRYKKLGLVNVLMILTFALTLVIALMLLGIQLTLAGAVTAVAGLALLCGSNFATFEAVRKETLKGKTIGTSVKDGYKAMLAGILEMHVILLVVSIFLSFVGLGELAGCGIILFISTVASYVLYWFTRFMWYVISSLVKDKFRFCGYIREELEDVD